MNDERKAELRSILEGFNLNKTGVTLVLLTLAVLAVGVLAALRTVL
jgi:Na+-transporting methylmalonyl-CoA/oxaloacetate decarboxylase gamma subunit